MTTPAENAPRLTEAEAREAALHAAWTYGAAQAQGDSVESLLRISKDAHAALDRYRDSVRERALEEAAQVCERSADVWDGERDTDERSEDLAWENRQAAQFIRSLLSVEEPR